jgi:hypothetical protein
LSTNAKTPKPYARAFDVQSAPLSFLAAVLIIFGICDLVAVGMPEDIARHHWGTQGWWHRFNSTNVKITDFSSPAPVRLTLFFGLTIYSFLFSSTSPLFNSRRYTPSLWGEGLKNRLVFSWAFLELVTWFWIFVTLREERREAAVRAAQRRAAQDEMM